MIDKKKERINLKFSDFALQISNRVNPSETDLKKYIGLTHLDPESFSIKRFGSPSDVKGEKLLVKAGDIIFGKRRAYQRKLAIADSDCICSAHAFVFRAKQDKIVDSFFPFFLQSDQFMKRAIKISVGSLSPTINWGTLKEQMFSLPPIEEQLKLAELFGIIEENIEKNEFLYKKLLLLEKSLMNKFFTYSQSSLKANFEQNRDIIKLKDIILYKKGKKPKVFFEKKRKDLLPYLSAEYLRNNNIEVKYVDISEDNVVVSDKTNIILIWDGSNAGSFFKGTEGVVSSTMVKISLKTDKEILLDFLYYALKVRDNYLKYRTQGTGIPHIYKQIFDNIMIYIPEIKEQRRILKIITHIERIYSNVEKQLNILRYLKKRISQEYI